MRVPGRNAIGMRALQRAPRSAVALFFLWSFANAAPANATGEAPDEPAAYAAAFVTQSVPSFIELFAPAAVSVTMRNTGTVTWLVSDGDVFLATQQPQDNYFWCIQDNRHGMYSGNRVLLPHDVAPGAAVTFDFVVKPLACGFAARAPFRFRMLSQLHGTFGEETPAPDVVLSSAAQFVSQQVPTRAPAGAKLRVSVVFRNTTLTAWPKDGYALAALDAGIAAMWSVAPVPLGAPVAPGASATFTFDITVPGTPGTYNLQWRMTSGAVPFGQASPPTAVEVIDAGPANYGGLWWASPAGSESGWGLNLAHEGDTIFATWFTYDDAGRPSWFSMTATATTTIGEYAGVLVRTTGPPFDSVPFRPERVRAVNVGTATLAFETAKTPFDVLNGTFRYTLNGVAQTKAITRQVFGPLPTCTFALSVDPATAYNDQALWWAAPANSQPGWGISLTHQGDVIFATWFTYGADTAPVWFSVTAPRANDGTYGGTLYRTTGPPFSAKPFDPARVVASAVGTARFTFSDGNTARFDWSVDGETGSQSITRQIIQDPGTICQ